MASKFDKEEQIHFSDCNHDNSESESDNEYNNSKSSHACGRSSPDGNFDSRIVNDTRCGGPCSPDELFCYSCWWGWTYWRRPNKVVIFTCGDSIQLCDHCHSRYYFNCPWHPRDPRQ